MSTLKEKIRASLQDPILYRNLKNFASAYKISREKAFEGLDFHKLVTDLSTRKARGLDQIMELFYKFKKNVEDKGATVHQAKDALDACKYITDICIKHNSEYIVKSKSMTSEEIKLNHYLEKEGLKPIETDLGEWILQIANEHPSHMVMPAIHKSRQQVAEIFRKYTGEDIQDDDINKMVKIARKYLRDYYFKAQVGITGANVAVASTGTIGLVTNEGNGRLTATVPPVHIVLLGYEKLVSDFDEALKVIKLLPKAATGQIISTYVTWIKGQNPSFKSQSGIKETHYIFLDNGRLTFFNDPLLKEALKCIRCGSCANICPAYEMVGGHTFGYIYIGAIGTILTKMYHSEQVAKELLRLCIGCKACSSFCPAGIDLQKIMSLLTVDLGEKYGVPLSKRLIYRNIISNPSTFRKTLKVGSLLQRPFLTNDKKHLNNIPLPSDKNFRILPSISSETFSQQFTNIKGNNITDKKVFFYPGCAVEYFYPEMGTALVKVLNKIGVGVDIPPIQVCCGLPALHAGDKTGGEKTIRKNLEYMPDITKYDALLVLCPSCGMAIKDDFPTYSDKSIREKAELIGAKTISLREYLERQKIKISTKFDAKVTYHTPCHQGRGLGSSAEGFLKIILPNNFIPLKDSNVCCGFGGSYSIEFAEISKGILDKKIEHIVETGADIVLTDCPGCVMQIEGGLLKKQINKKVLHLSAFFEQYLEVTKI
ncbi:MAG: LUD domain-containing protein [Calditerrivibrio sp.]|nr:LUD domain-containing protein [Calditerrivibrio sp.]